MSFLSHLFGGRGEAEEIAHTGKLFESPYAPQINEHFEKNFPGRTTTVWQDADGMEIHLMAPTETERYYVAYTVGMSANLMELDNMAHNKQYAYLRTAELMMYLPADWPAEEMMKLPQGEAPSREQCWPLRMLYRLACMPQKNNTWLGNGHSIPNGDPPHALADNTGFCGAVLYLPAQKNGPKEVHPVSIKVSKKVLLYVVVPVYKEEMDMKVASGANYLEADLRELPDFTGFIVTPDRPAVCKPDEGEDEE